MDGTLTRRGVLGLGGAGALLAGCGRAGPPTPGPSSGEASGGASANGVKRVRYGADEHSQFADLRMPTAKPLATVVLLHGGYWLPQYGLDLMNPLAERLTELGHPTWNVEYRRTQAGGGFPNTLLDVAAAIDRLAGAGLPAGLAESVVLLGHSAGGQLAAWTASRSGRTPGGAARVRPRGAISLSGLLDLTGAATGATSANPVVAFMGGDPAQVPDRYAVADPTLLVPASCPVWAVHARQDGTVPVSQSTTYVKKAKAAGGVAERVLVPGDHLAIIDPTAPSFATISRLLESASA